MATALKFFKNVKTVVIFLKNVNKQLSNLGWTWATSLEQPSSEMLEFLHFYGLRHFIRPLDAQNVKKTEDRID